MAVTHHNFMEWPSVHHSNILNGGLSVASKQYHRLLLRSSEGIYNTETIIRLLLEVKL